MSNEWLEITGQGVCRFTFRMGERAAGDAVRLFQAASDFCSHLQPTCSDHLHAEVYEGTQEIDNRASLNLSNISILFICN